MKTAEVKRRLFWLQQTALREIYMDDETPCVDARAAFNISSEAYQHIEELEKKLEKAEKASA